MKTVIISSILVLAACAWAGCDAFDDDTDLGGLIASQFVSITVDPADIADGFLTSDGEVTPETFLVQLEDKASSITSVNVSRIELAPGANGVEGVVAWADVYQGELLVQLVPSGGSPVQIGRVEVPATGLDELSVPVTTNRSALDSAPNIAAGRFAVRVTAGTPRTAGDDFQLPLRAEIEFQVF